MKREEKKIGYQYLDNSFWDLCKQRKIYRLPQHLYIYLRGRYAKFGPTFTWSDSEIRKHLGITQQTLRNAKNYLQERGLIVFKSGLGGRRTQYTMLASVLLPEKAQVMKIITPSDENHHTKCRKSSLGSSGLVNNKVNNKVGVSQKEKPFKKYDPNNRESLRYKNRLSEILKKYKPEG